MGLNACKLRIRIRIHRTGSNKKTPSWVLQENKEEYTLYQNPVSSADFCDLNIYTGVCWLLLYSVPLSSVMTFVHFFRLGFLRVVGIRFAVNWLMVILRATTKCPPPQLFCQIGTRLVCLHCDVPPVFFCSCQKTKIKPLCCPCCFRNTGAHIVQYDQKRLCNNDKTHHVWYMLRANQLALLNGINSVLLVCRM